MNHFRFSKLLYVVLLFTLAACQAPVVPLAQAIVPLSAALTTPANGAASMPSIALPTTLAPTVVSAQGLTKFTPKTFDLPINLSYSPAWSVGEEYSDEFLLKYVGHDAGVAFIHVKNAKIGAGIAFPDDFAAWIQSPDSLFQVKESKPVLVGGFKGIQINATAVCSHKTNWIILSGTGWLCPNGEHIGFIYLADVYGERVLIQIQGSPSGEDYKFIVDESQKVLDTVGFSKPVSTDQPKSPQLVEYKLPAMASEPGGIVVGPDAALWFIETATNKIGRITYNGVVTEFPVPTAGAIDPEQGFLAVGVEGALWFNEDLVNQIGRMSIGGQVTEYKLPDELKPTQDDAPIRGMVAGPDGALWVTSPGANAIVKLTPDGKIASKFALPKTGSNPVGIVVGPDGAFWFVESGVNQIGRLTLDGKLTEYALPENSKALRITVGSDKALWFTMYSVNKIGRMTTEGQLTTFDTAGMGPVGITTGPDGAVWFTGYASSEIGRMSTDGKLTKLKIPTSSSVPYHIVVGPDGNMWFTEQQGNQIGQIKLPASTSTQPAADMPTANVLAEWKVNNPSGIFIGFDSVWVPGHHDKTTTRIDPATNKVIAVIQGTGDHAEQALAVGDMLWVTGQQNDTTWIDPKTNTATSTAPRVPGHLHYIASGFNSLWITTADNKLDRIDPATSKTIASISYADGYAECQGFVVATKVAVWVIDCDTSELIKIDPATNSVAAKTPWTKLADQAKAQTTIPAGKGTDFIWMSIGGDGIPEGLLRVDPNTGTGLTFLPLIPDQSGDGFLAVSDAAVWIGGLGQINRVNIATNQIDTTYKTKPGAIIHIGLGFGSVWLENYEENLVQRLDITP